MYSNLKTEITNQYYRLPRLQKLVKWLCKYSLVHSPPPWISTWSIGEFSSKWCAQMDFLFNIWKLHMHHMKHHVHRGICSKTHRVLPTVWWGLLNVRELYCSLTTHWSNVRTIANELLIQRQLVYCKPICTYFYHN